MAGYQSDGDVEQVYALEVTGNNDLFIPPYLTAGAKFGRVLLVPLEFPGVSPSGNVSAHVIRPPHHTPQKSGRCFKFSVEKGKKEINKDSPGVRSQPAVFIRTFIAVESSSLRRPLEEVFYISITPRPPLPLHLSLQTHSAITPSSLLLLLLDLLRLLFLSLILLLFFSKIHKKEKR